MVGPGRETGRVSRFRLYPTPARETAVLGHCAQARFVGNLALEQANSYGTAGRTSSPNFAAQCRQLTEARAEHAWLAAGSQTVQQQARRDPDQARRFALIRVEDLRVRNMTRSAKGTMDAPGDAPRDAPGDAPGTNVRPKAGLNRAILDKGWGVLVTRLEQKAPGRVEHR